MMLVELIVRFILTMMKYATLVAAIQIACVGVKVANAQPLREQAGIVLCILAAAAADAFRKIICAGGK